MIRKIVQCYVFILTLLDISLNTKLTAQGKSHDVTVHDSLLEGITFQEWGKESPAADADTGGTGEALRLSPASLSFGRAALAAAHHLTVTVTNTANTTVHLASVAGTTPDFHASFFESKTLPPQGNTTFSVVYLGRREGPVSAHLYIYTSLGVHKYPVHATGVASEWGVWPLVGLRVPHDASLEPLLELHNPTDQPVQVKEVYSSGAWVSLSLPGGAGGVEAGADGQGGAGAPGEAWRVPPHETRPIVRLKLRPSMDRPRPAYIRIKGSCVGGLAGGLVVGVEAVAAGPGPYLAPPQLRLRLRGSSDPPGTWELMAGNSGESAVGVGGAVWGARCERRPPALQPRPSPAPPYGDSAPNPALAARANGAKAEGVSVRALTGQLAPHQAPVTALQLTLNYDRLWASVEGGPGAGEDGDGAWCSGWVVLGPAAMPYSLRLLPGTLALQPTHLHIVTSEGNIKERSVRARNDFSVPVLVHAMHCGPQLLQHFQCTSLGPLVLEAGQQATVGRVAPSPSAPGPGPGPPPLRDIITLRTNLTDYTLPVAVHSGAFTLEWEWPNSKRGTLQLGSIGARSTRRIGLRLHNAGPGPLCARSVRAALPPASASVSLATCLHYPQPSPDHACRCVEGGGWLQAWLTVVAGAGPGPLTGSLEVESQHTSRRYPLTARVTAGRLAARIAPAPQAAPYLNSWAALVVDNSMSLSVRLLALTQSDADVPVEFQVVGSGRLRRGRQIAGRVRLAVEHACQPQDAADNRTHDAISPQPCYLGLALDTPEGLAWLERGRLVDAASIERDVAEMGGRRDMLAARPRPPPALLHLHTTQVVQLPVPVRFSLQWPRLGRWLAGPGARGLAGGGVPPITGPGAPPLTGSVGGALPSRVLLRNPCSRPVLLQPVILAPPAGDALPDILKPFCSTEECVLSADAFKITSWRVLTGTVTGAGEAFSPRAPKTEEGIPTAFLLQPRAELELGLTFSPARAAPLLSYLYLRNNYTIVETVPLWGLGAHPSFELGGRRPGSAAPLVFELTECPPPGVGLRRQLLLRNTGPVPLRLRDWRLAGRPCAARGFRLQPCGPLALQPNQTRALRLAFHPDYTLARVPASLTVRADAARAEFRLRAAAPARLLYACAAQHPPPPPPFDPPLRVGGAVLALAALALVVAAAALDAERALRRARHARPPPAPPMHAPLDLRAAARVPLAPQPPAPAPAPPARRRRAPRRPPPPDPRAPLAERRAFERWRAEVLRRADRAEEHSGEDAAAPPPRRTPSPPDVDPDHTPELDETGPPSSDEAGRSGDSSVGSDESPGEEPEERDDSERETRSAPAEHPADDPPVPAEPETDPTGRIVEYRNETRPREPPRRPERRAETAEARARAAAARAHARRAACGRRRGGGERSTAGGTGGAGTPSRSPPALPPAPEMRAPAALRWGASWSEVVAAGGAPAVPGGAAGPPLPPIGSDVRRHQHAEERADHSLFYFNGEQPPPPPPSQPPERFPWRAPPALDRPQYPAPVVHDYLSDFDEQSPGAYGSVWAGGAWAWGGGLGVRPPPGFSAAPVPAAPAPHTPRAYDPFRSLAAIWAPGAGAGAGAFDWRTAAPPAQAPDEPRPQPDE
ncbi:unnamed protein product [Chilo suppressalis]|uniref:Transmembrane protein 131 n=1 Tax=Chilo suppressalis TaxID=168631 RepID=A0ABN8ASZ7_CHISP|nr:unnamed protein product [Chilo suppressalis]